jgi:hypothetical protein
MSVLSHPVGRPSEPEARPSEGTCRRLALETSGNQYAPNKWLERTSLRRHGAWERRGQAPRRLCSPLSHTVRRRGVVSNE